jgi:hypothetical protein
MPRIQLKRLIDDLTAPPEKRYGEKTRIDISASYHTKLIKSTSKELNLIRKIFKYMF